MTVSNDRHIIHTVHTDDGELEIYWGRANDDWPELIAMHERTGLPFNSVILQKNGSLTWKGWTDSEVPISVVIDANRVIVATTEDALYDAETIEQNRQYIVFDSATLENPS